MVSLGEEISCNKRSAKNIEIQEACQQVELRWHHISGDKRANEYNKVEKQNRIRINVFS